MNHESPQFYLLRDYEVRKTRNKAYSLRAYALYLGIPSGRLSEYLKGTREITPKMGERLLQKLALTPEQKEEFHCLTNKLEPTVLPFSRSLIDHDTFELLKDWYYFPLLSLFETTDFQQDPIWIGRRLGLRAHEVTQALERLIRIGLLKINESGKLILTQAGFETNRDESSKALQMAHHEELNRSHQILDETPVELRDFSSFSMAIDPRKIPEAKKMIEEFQQKMSALLEKEQRSEVYNLNIHFFPVTKRMLQ